jgi:hypothetical protein
LIPSLSIKSQIFSVQAPSRCLQNEPTAFFREFPSATLIPIKVAIISWFSIMFSPRIMYNFLILLTLLVAGVVHTSDPLQVPLRDKISVPATGNYDTKEAHPHNSSRVKRQNSTLCDTLADQYTGWIDIEAHFLLVLCT